MSSHPRLKMRPHLRVGEPEPKSSRFRHRASKMTARFLVLFMAASSLIHADERPNFLVVMVDDMGFSDLGCYGGEVDTPHLDQLAANGLRFTQFYNTARCWPSRAALMTGRYPHEVGHAMMFGKDAPRAYRGTTREQGQFVSEVLGPMGYLCYHVGKWHLHNRAIPKPMPGKYASPQYNDSWPLGRGFHHSYCMKSQNNFFNPNQVFDEDKLVKRPGANTAYYATDAFTNRTIRYLKDHATQHTEEPFFVYLAHTAPHFPLHALPEDIERHKQRYRKGWDKIRAERLARQKEMKLLDCELSPRDEEAAAWDSLTEENRETWSTRMAIHAAMIHRVDIGIGQIVEQLRSMDALDNTLILFLSDNGASAEYLVRGDGHDSTALPGSAATYLCLEVAWSNASNTPFRQHKMWTHEGGIATPLIAHWPSSIQQHGALTHQVGHIIDIAPTLVDLAKQEDDVPNVNPPLTGKSLVPILSGKQREPHEFLFWEHTGNKAIRQGDWKLVAENGKPWQLFNLKQDRSELVDLAATEADRVQQLLKDWQAYADKTGVVDWNTLPQSKRSPGPDYRKK